MAMALQSRERAAVQALRTWLPWCALVLGVGLTTANLLGWFRAAGPAPGVEPRGAEEAPAPSPTTVVLPEAKFQTAGIQVAPPELVTLPAELGVAGRIESNQESQVQVRPRAAGVIREVKVALGQKVKKGDTLAVLDSPDIGTARLDLRARQRELATARIEAQFRREIAANVASLIPELRKNVEPATIDKTYADKTLGSYRATLLSAYAKYAVAKHEEEKTAGLFRQQIVGEHPILVATHNREGAQAEFEAAVEQARFDANQQSLLANQKLSQAEANVIDAGQRLRILGVPENIVALLAQASTIAASAEQSATEDVTAYHILAPFDGTIIVKAAMAVASQKADLNDMLFTLADLSTVWVQANIPESDFALLPALQKGTIRLGAAAYPGRAFAARLLSVGATVDPTTRTVPMLAETSNADGLLKVGMFVRITLDTAVDTKVLSVPVSAVVEIDEVKGVFLTTPAVEGHNYTFHPVKLGRVSGDRQVVTSGLKQSDSVVTRGAFVLKSELILQNETEDE